LGGHVDPVAHVVNLMGWAVRHADDVSRTLLGDPLAVAPDLHWRPDHILLNSLALGRGLAQSPHRRPAERGSV
jgi:hypothetical protein